MRALEKKRDDMYERTKMQKQVIIQRLKEQGCRITKQRLLILDTILEEDCSCCKDIYAIVSRKDAGIGAATVYRMINTLEEIGAINRKNMYKVCCGEDECRFRSVCTVELDDDTVIELTGKNLNHVIRAGLLACGYMSGQGVRNVLTMPSA